MTYIDHLLKLADDFENEANDFGLVEDPNDRKARYILEQPKMDPDAMERHRKGLRERQQRFYEKIDPTKLQGLEEKKWEQKKQQMGADTLEGMSVKLRQQIADAKTSLGRSADPTKLADFERNAVKLYALRNKIKELLQGVSNPIVFLSEMLNEANEIHFLVRGKQNAISHTLQRIIGKLEEMLEQYER